VPALYDGRPRQTYRRWREGAPLRMLVDVVRGLEEGENVPWRGRRWIIERQLWPAWYALVNLEKKSARVFWAENIEYLPVEANLSGRFPIPWLGIEFSFWDGVYQGVEGCWFRAWDSASGALASVLEERPELGDDPRGVLEVLLSRRPTDRRLRLFAVA